MNPDDPDGASLAAASQPVYRSVVMNIVDRIALRASAQQPALIADGVTLTYGELIDRVSALADSLKRLPAYELPGVPRVALACPGGIDYIVIALAILKSGACLVPVADELTDPEREELVERTACRVVLLGPDSVWLGGGMESISGCAGLAVVDLGEREFSHEDEFARLNPAFIRFSSGTTGRSKGVVISHSKLEERVLAANAALAIGPDDRVLWLLPMAHHFAVSIILYLYHGACTVIAEDHLAARVLALAEETGATVIYGSPFHHALLAADQGGLGWKDLRLAVSTAAPLTEDVAARFAARFGRPLVQGLGVIEIGLPLLNTDGPAEAPTSVGRPLPGFRVDLRDGEGRALGAGVIGELWVRGPGMFDAYLSPWQLVDQVCVEGWFPTGDLAEVDAQGRIFIRGRTKSVINVSGMKVFPEEVEAVISSHPAVRFCRVSGIKHRVFGSIPVAEVVASAVAPRDLIAWCRGKLSPYKIPARVTLVPDLPLTPSGKIRRDASPGISADSENTD